MSKSSLIIGLVVSALIHAVFLVPALGKRGASPPSAEPRQAVIVVPPPEETQPIEPTDSQPVIPPPPEETVQREPPSPPPIEMAEVVTPPTPDSIETTGNTDSDVVADDEKLIPATRIIWESPKQLARVARLLKMRIVAVDAAGDVAGELVLWGALRMKPFDGRMDVYSNRVRSLPLSFFGSELRLDLDADVVGFWILVPEDVDRQMADVVRGAVRAKGFRAAEVDWVEAAFDEGALGGARFVVIEVHPAVGVVKPTTEHERQKA